MTRQAVLACLLSLALAPAARADVYGYVDPDGTLHLATDQLDERYTLFLKSGDGRATVVRGGDAAAAPDQALMKTRLFQRLVDHPNIAKYEPTIRAAALRHGLDPQFVKAVIAVESGFEPGAVSDKGAIGLMQIIPATGERYGVQADRTKTVEAKLADPVLNLEIGTRYLSDLKKMFADRPDLVLAAYNAGENAVLRNHKAIPPFPETLAYVKLVDQFHAFYNPTRNAPKSAADEVRVRVTIAARRNLPDPGVPLRLPAPPAAGPGPEPVASIEVPRPAPVDDEAIPIR